MSTDNIKEAIDAGKQIGGAAPRFPYDSGAAYTPGEEIPFVVVPAGSQVVSLENQLRRDFPKRRKAEVSLVTAESFARYVNAFKGPDTQLFGDCVITDNGQTCKVEAVIDYHAAGEDGAARWGVHRATLQLRETEAWETWLAKDGERVSQAEFGTFIEDNMADIAAPDGATLFEIVMNFESTKGLKLAQSTRLNDGQTKLTYNETIESSSRVGDKVVTVPKEFTVVIAPYDGAGRYPLQARIRYRTGGQLTIGYDLLRPLEVLTDAFNDTLTAIETATGLSILRGTAPKWQG